MGLSLVRVDGEKDTPIPVIMSWYLRDKTLGWSCFDVTCRSRSFTGQRTRTVVIQFARTFGTGRVALTETSTGRCRRKPWACSPMAPWIGAFFGSSP